MRTKNKIIFKEHPLNRHYTGIEEPRDWMFDVHGYNKSFFAFWKQCEPFLSKHL
jgi:deoxyribodipyrimidine photo-lyase